MATPRREHNARLAASFDQDRGPHRIRWKSPPSYLLRPMFFPRWFLNVACIAILCGSGTSVGHASCGDWLASHPASGETDVEDSSDQAHRAPGSGRHRTPCQGRFCRGSEPLPALPEPVLSASSDQAGADSRCLQPLEIRPASRGEVFESPPRVADRIFRRIDRPPKG